MRKDNEIAYSQTTPSTEQVDLVDILLLLWRGKKTILVTIVALLVLATLYIFLAKEKWTSTAILTQPDAGQIAEYTNSMGILYGPDESNIPATQKLFIERFNASFYALAESLDNKAIREKLLIEPALPGQDLPMKVAYTGSSAEEAQKKLAGYIQQVDDEVVDGIKADFAVNVNARISTLKESLNAQEKVAAEQKKLRLAQIGQALAVANQSNIKEPQAQQSDQISQDTMFLLGSVALSAMVKNEQSRPLVFSDDYYKNRQSLLASMSMNTDIKNIHTYRYVMKPTLPITRDAPKSILSIIVAVVLGLIIGAAIVLSRNAIKYRKRTL